MNSSALDLLHLLQAIFGLPTLALPLVFAIRAKDGWAIAGVIVLTMFCLTLLAGLGNGGVGAVFDQIIAIMLWFCAFLLGIAATYGRRPPAP